MELDEAGHGHAVAQAALQHALNLATGSHMLRLACTLWVYNLTGVPISLRQSIDDVLLVRDGELKHEEDVVSWLAGAPYWVKFPLSSAPTSVE